MNATELASLASAAITAVGVPAIYWQARNAAKAVHVPVAAADITARAQHAQARLAAQRTAYLDLLRAIRNLRDTYARVRADAHRWDRVLSSREVTDAQRADAEEARSSRAESVGAAYKTLNDAMATVALEGPDDLTPLLEPFNRFGAMVYGAHILPVDVLSSPAAILHDQFWQDYERAERQFVTAARTYLNDGRGDTN
ncbi:hypothetical protein [Streptomyces sp. NPDC086023]|uniref:hypothetical protein n=1 Tax=Streptomyces sp. NPDC086023 TaxID=3365746 RepID=UPI0037D3F559